MLSPVVNIVPINRTVDEGVKTTFTCMASGVGNNSFTYQWFLNNNRVSGEDKRILNTVASQDRSGSYTCSVKNQYGNVTQSETAVLIILSKLITLFLNCIFSLFGRQIL